MENDICVRDLISGSSVTGFYILSSAQLKRTSAGKPYLNAVLSDATGSIEAKLWDYSGDYETNGVGRIIKVRGEVLEYKGSLQMTIQRIRYVQEQDHVDLTALVPSAPIDPSAAMDEIRQLVDTIADDDYRRICLVMLERHQEGFSVIPAAKSMHHAFRHGLLMHTADMLHLADFLADAYREVIDRSLLLAGTLLHDFAKLEEFTFSELGLVTEYSVKGSLLGHLVMGAQEVADVARELDIPEEKSVLLQHLLLSHHGTPEFGAAVIPRCAESELLSYIDLIDSRMEIYAEAFENTEEGSFTPRIHAIEKNVYRHRMS